MSEHSCLRRVAAVLGLVTIAAVAESQESWAQPPNSGAAMQCQRSDESLTELGLWFDPNRSVSAFSRTQDILSPFPTVTARYFRLKLAPDPGEAKDWFLTIRDGKFRVLATLAPADLTGAAGAAHWTGRLEARTVSLDLHLDKEDSGTRIRATEGIVMPASAPHPYYSWQGNAARYISLYEYPGGQEHKRRIRRLGDPVGFLIANGPNRQGKFASWCCSGVLIARGLLLTNWHCGSPPGMPAAAYWHSSICAASLIDFSWDDDGASQEHSCAKVEVSDEALDYAVLRVSTAIGTGQSASGPRPTVISLADLAEDQAIRLIHHAECLSKRISFDCKIRNVQIDGWRNDRLDRQVQEFAHDCDTEGGSSGAPVFDSEGALIGLHHLGFSIDENTCKPKDKVNKAIRISDIMEHIRAKAPALYDEIRKNGFVRD